MLLQRRLREQLGLLRLVGRRLVATHHDGVLAILHHETLAVYALLLLLSVVRLDGAHVTGRLVANVLEEVATAGLEGLPQR